MLAMAAGMGLATGVFLLAGMGSAQAGRAGERQPDRQADRMGGQPGGRPDRPPQRPDGGAGRPGGPMGDERAPMSPEDLRARLERRLGDVRLLEARLTEAIGSLDEGADPQQVIDAMFAPGAPPADRNLWSRPSARGPMDEAERARAMSSLRERLPRVAVWIEELEREDPRLLEMLRTRLLPQWAAIEDMRARDPERAGIMSQEFMSTLMVMRGTRVYRMNVQRFGADSAQAGEARDALRASLQAQFDARLEGAEHEIGHLRERLRTLEADVEAQRADRQTLIDQAIRRIEQEAPRRGS
ncbi:MAG: hypothetical protein KDA05_08355 [Phycisphaerales bacterium]|nr:hypothetical protein [Phycisphaerales bacterium]